MIEVFRPSSAEITGFLETLEVAIKEKVVYLANKMYGTGEVVNEEVAFKAALDLSARKSKNGNEYEQLCLRLEEFGGVVSHYSIGVTELGFCLAIYRYFLMLRDADFANTTNEAAEMKEKAQNLMGKVTVYADGIDLIGLLNLLFDYELDIPVWVVSLTRS